MGGLVCKGRKINKTGNSGQNSAGGPFFWLFICIRKGLAIVEPSQSDLFLSTPVFRSHSTFQRADFLFGKRPDAPRSGIKPRPDRIRLRLIGL